MIRHLLYNLLLLVAFFGSAVAIGSDAGRDPDLASGSASPWWVSQALKNLDAIDDPETLSGASYQMVYPLVRNGRLEEAARIARNVVDPQLRVFAQIAVAKEHLRRGDELLFLNRLSEVHDIALAGGRANDLVRAYMEAGRLDEATVIAKLVPAKKSDPMNYARSQALDVVIRQLAKQGDTERALRFVEQHKQSGSRRKANAYVAIAYTAASAGRIEDTELVLQRIPEQEYRDNAYRNLVVALAAGGQPEGENNSEQCRLARQYAAKVVDPVLRAKALASIAGKEGRAVEDAASLRASINDAGTREEKLALAQRLFDLHIKKNDPAEAEKVLELMVRHIEETPREKVTSKFGVFDDQGAIASVKIKYARTAPLWKQQGEDQKLSASLANAKKGYLVLSEKGGLSYLLTMPEVLATLYALDDAESFREFLDRRLAVAPDFEKGDIAAYYIRLGDHEAAERIAESFGDETLKGASVAKLAWAWIAAEEFDRAKRLMAKLGDARREVEAYQEVGRELVDANRIDELREWLPEMPSPASRVYACVGALEGLHWQEKKTERD